MENPLIFLSHASADKSLADHFKNLLVMGFNLRQSDIFYTSSIATGIPIGTDSNQYMQRQLKGARIIISLITPSFHESAYCMCELGYQSQLKNVILYPIIFPYVQADLIAHLVKDLSQHKISNPDCLYHLANVCKSKLNYFSMSAWAEESDKFMAIFHELKNKIAIKHLIQKSLFDEWSNSLYIITHSVQPGHEPGEGGYLANKPCKSYSFDSDRKISFTLDGEKAILIDICRNGKIANSPHSSGIADINLKLPKAGLITIMIPPPGFKGENAPDNNTQPFTCAYRYIDWYKSNGISTLWKELDSIIEEVYGDLHE